MDHMENASREQERGRNLVLYKSAFGTRFMVCGNMCEGTDDREFKEAPQKCSAVGVCCFILFNLSQQRLWVRS
jgi:predicted secreted acid phosphatase